MDESTHNQEERLQQEILADAKSRASKIVARARRAAQTAQERADAEAAAVRERTLEHCRKESDQKARNILQGIWMEERRQWLKRREECLDAFFASILKEACGLAADDRERRRSLENLLKEAFQAMGEGELLVEVSPADAPLVTPVWIGEKTGRATGVTVKAVDSIGGGVRVSTMDRSRVYDNTYGGRLGRLAEDFRREVAGCDK